jgi:long-chain fatty acid transport protein
VSPVGRSAIQLVIDVPPALRDLVRVPSDIMGSVPVPANFQDRFVPRLGAEGVALREPGVEIRVRGGAFYENSPAPSQTGYTNLIDTDRWAFSAGAGLLLNQLRPFLPGFLNFDLHFQYAYFPERTMTKTSLVDPVGDYRAAGHGFAGGLTMEVGFE